MRIRYIFMLSMVFFCLLISENTIGQSIVKDVDITSEEAKVQFSDETPSSYFIEIGGPNNYYWKETIDYTNEISLSNINAKGEKFKDGLYSIQITPVFELTPEQRADLSEMRMKNDQEGIAAYRKANNLPDVVDKFSMNFRIQEGKYVIPTQQEGDLNLPTMSSRWELDHPSLYASINTVGLEYPSYATDNSALAVDQQILDDLIVVGSICVGQDCNNGESFGFDTVRLKENNLRIKFLDTSTSASFPSTDWELTANDSSNGGLNRFSITDITAGRTPFTVEGGAPNHSLYVEDSGEVGLGTNQPVVELHIVDGDTPTMRLEQDGSSGFQQHTWDVAGNETNFFVRDVTGGSKLPFKITPGAPDNLLYLKGGSHDNIGINTSSPNIGARLHINATNSMILPLGTDAQRPFAVEGMLRGNNTSNIVEYYNGSSWVDLTSGGGGGSSPWTLSGGNVYRSSGNVGIGVSSTNFNLAVEGTTGGIYLNRTSGSEPFVLLKQNGGGSGTQGNSGGQIRGLLNGGFRFTNDNTSSTWMLIDNNGNVGIGTGNATPSHKLEVCGSIGTTSASVTTSITCSSDRRFKKNISPLQNSLEKVLNLQGVNYDWRMDEFPDKHFNEGQQLGFIAQEIEEVLPLVVQTDKEGYKSVDYSRLTPVLVEAIKEQQSIIDAQQAEINSLQSQVASLEELKAQVAALTQMVMKQKDGDAKSNNQVGDE